jgi:hypothetical protein
MYWLMDEEEVLKRLRRFLDFDVAPFLGHNPSLFYEDFVEFFVKYNLPRDRIFQKILFNDKV